MILIGQQERVLIVGPTEAHHCLRCQTETEFAPQLRYKMARIDLLFGFTYQWPVGCGGTDTSVEDRAC